MFIGFIYVIGVFTLSAGVFGFIDEKIEKNIAEEEKEKLNNENKLKSVNRYWTNIDVK